MKEVISEKQAITMMMMFLIGSTLVLGLAGEAKQDAWLAVIIAVIMASPIVAIYARIVRIFPGESIYDILNKLFGTIGGKVIASLVVWYSFHLGSLVIRNFSEFITTVSLPETPQQFIQLLVALIAVWIAKNGIEVLARWSEITLGFVVVIVTTTILLSFTQIEFSNIKPVLYDGLGPVLKGAFSLFSTPFAETVVFLSVLSCLKQGANCFKVYFLTVILIGILILFIVTRNILVLGIPTLSILYFPSYEAVSMIKIGEFIQRFEIVVSTIFLLCGLLKTTVCLLSASQGIAKIINIPDYRVLVVPIGLLMFNLSSIIYGNTKEMFEWLQVYRIYAIPFQVILPTLIWIMAEVQRGKIQRIKSS